MRLPRRLASTPIVSLPRRSVLSKLQLKEGPPTPRLGGVQIGLLVIATGDYVALAERLIESANHNFLTGHRLVPFVFTEDVLGDRSTFPEASLYRYHVFLSQAERLEAMDYLFYCDADMLVVDTVGDEILSRLVATQHPGYVGKRGPFETRAESRACVASGEGGDYFYGGFQGGEARAYLEAAAEMAAQIDDDAARGVMAIWHDESHWNRYLVDHPASRTLTPSYAYPETQGRYYRRLWGKNYPPKIVALDKEKGRYRYAPLTRAVKQR